MAQKRDLFVCHTYYQVFVSCIRAMRLPLPPDLVLGAGVLPGAEALKERLVQSGLFGTVQLYDEQKSGAPLYQNPLAVLLLQHPMHRWHIEHRKGMRVRWRQYGRVYFYNDWTDLGRYAQDCHARYILCEDTFANNAQQTICWWDWQTAQPHYKLRRALGYGYLYWGGYKHVVGIETEEIARTGPWGHHLIEDSKAALFASVTGPEKQRLAGVFITAPLPEQAPNPLLLLTRPFVEDGMFADYDAQMAFFRQLLARYGAGYTIFIKPHPRDKGDYAAAFPEATVLDKNMPSEAMNLVMPFRFARALTVASQSLKTLTCADEKLMLTLEESLGTEARDAFRQRMIEGQG